MRRDTYNALEKVAEAHWWDKITDVAADGVKWAGEQIGRGVDWAGKEISDAGLDLGTWLQRGWGTARMGIDKPDMESLLRALESDNPEEYERYRSMFSQASAGGQPLEAVQEVLANIPGSTELLRLWGSGQLNNPQYRKNVAAFLRAAQAMQGWMGDDGKLTAAGMAAAMSDAGRRHLMILSRGLASSADSPETNYGIHLLNDPESNSDLYDQVAAYSDMINGAYENYDSLRQLYRLQQAPISTAMEALFSSNPQDMYGLIDTVQGAFTPGNYVYENFIRGNSDYERYRSYVPWLHFAGNIRSLFDNGNFSRYPSLFEEFNPGATRSSTSGESSGDASADASATAKGSGDSTDQATRTPTETTALNTRSLLYQNQTFGTDQYTKNYV